MELRALVVGCSSGIGRATALALAKNGYEVLASARHSSAIEDMPVRAHLELDTTDGESVMRAVTAAGHVDVLVSTAGFGLQGPVERVPIGEVRELFETNFFGTMRLLQALVPQMRQRRSGTIVIVSSIAARQARPFTGFYAASKAAVELMVEALSYEVEEYHVRTLLVEPGSVATAFQGSRRSFAMEQPPYDSLAKRWNRTMRNRAHEPMGPEAVAEVIVRALADESWPFRTPVGADAEEILGLRDRLSDEEFRKYVWSSLRNDLSGKSPAALIDPERNTAS